MEKNFFSKFQNNVVLYAKGMASKKISAAHFEYVAAIDELFKELFISITDKVKYNSLIEEIELAAESAPKADEVFLEAHKDKAPALDYSATQVLTNIKKIANERFTVGEPLPPHIILAILTTPSKVESPMKDAFKKYDIDIEEFFKAMVDVVAEDIGAEPFYGSAADIIRKRLSEIFGFPAPGAQGAPGMGGEPNAAGEDWKSFCTDLTEKVKTYKKPFIGREDIIDRSVQVLCRMDKSNPVLVGEPGVGKTAITVGLAKRIIDGDVPAQIAGHKLYSVDLAAMLAGTKYRGDFEQRLTNLLKGAKKEGKCILFFDEIHTVIGAGASSNGQMDASNILKPYLVEGEIKFIGATTYEEFKNIEKDAALMRRFQKVDVKEPSIEDSIKILQGLKGAYEKYHGVTYTDDAIQAAVELTAKYVHDRFLPDKAIDMIDEAGAAKSISKGTEVAEEDISNVISVLCKIPKKSMEKDEYKSVRILDKTLKSKVYGQDKAVDEIVKAIKLSKSGLGPDDQPIGSFVFMGPTGTGKTELAKQLATALNIDFVRFDMSEYMDETAAQKFIGASAGYVGYEDGGLLVDAIRKTPHCVLLLDEIEKAHPSVFNIFLQVMSNAELTDNKGRVADFKNVIIIMTSNVGARDAYSHKQLGFTTDNKPSIDTSAMNAAFKRVFTPEFRNRLTAVVEFNAIDETIGKMVAEKELRELDAKLAAKGITAVYTNAVVNALVEKGVSPEYGAREIKRLVASEIVTKFVECIINNSDVKKYKVDFVNGEFVVSEDNKPKTSRKRKATVEVEK